MLRRTYLWLMCARGPSFDVPALPYRPRALELAELESRVLLSAVPYAGAA